MDVLRMDRADYRVVRLLLLAGLVSVPTTWAVQAGTWATGRDLTHPLDLDAAGIAPPEVTAAPGVEATWEGTAVVRLADASTSTWLVHLAPTLLLGLAALLVLVPLLRLTRAVERGEGFTGRVVTWLRVAAATLVVSPWLLELARAMADAHLLARTFETEPTLSLTATAGMVAVTTLGLVVAVVAEAFGRGRTLEQDVEGLV